MKESEWLTEGWVKFTRMYCKEGYIDRWMGDMINNPNNPQKHQMSLNAFATYYRLNGGKWISRREIHTGTILENLNMKNEFTAEEIWNDSLIKQQPC